MVMIIIRTPYRICHQGSNVMTPMDTKQGYLILESVLLKEDISIFIRVFRSEPLSARYRRCYKMLNYDYSYALLDSALG